jgi:hypothetical protein
MPNLMTVSTNIVLSRVVSLRAPHCKNIKSQSIRRYSKNIVRVGRRKLKRISIIIKNKLIYYQMEQGNKK